MKYGLLVSPVVAASLLGCAATMKSSVMDRAVFDLECPASSIDIHDLGLRTYGMVGCGRRATYIVSGDCVTKDSCRAIMNSDVKKI